MSNKSIQLKDISGNKYYVHPYYPIGAIYLSVSDTNPSQWFGGTWELIAQGRTLVGVDTTQTEFNTVKKIGGEKTHVLTVAELAAAAPLVPWVVDAKYANVAPIIATTKVATPITP